VEQIRQNEMVLIEKLIMGLKKIHQVKLYGPERQEDRMATLSFNFSHLSPSDGALRLEKEFGILCRPGLHCAPSAHHTIGTFPEGTIRFGLSAFNSEAEVETAIQAIFQISKER
jgi:cysteine desulfurase/selenocysteine lyase